MLRLICEAFILCLVQLLTLVTLFFRLLPHLLRVGWLILRIVLALSCIAYDWLFRLVRRVGVELTRPVVRVPACIILSLVACTLVLLITGSGLTLVLMGIAAGHGFIVGMAWNQLSLPAGLIVGV